MDEQSAAGKAPVGVACRAKRYGKPVAAVVGGRADSLDAVYEQGIDLVLPICRKPMDLEQALDPQEATTNLICAGEAAARSYDLARILVEQMASDWDAFKHFVLNAHLSDAGAKSAEQYMGIDLGEAASSLLEQQDGAGWSPNPDKWQNQNA